MYFGRIRILPDGGTIGSGGDAEANIRRCTVTQCVNSETELTPGSVCCASLEASVQMPEDGLGIRAGTEVAFYKVEEGNEPVAVGVFTLEKPTRTSANICKLTAYDHVAKLDVDLSEWLKGLTGWPYTLIGFAGMVCEACGLTLATTEIPNGSFPVRQFYKAGVTGRQLLRWVGEMACRFCRADADGNIVLDWYRQSGVTVRATGDRYYFAGSLSYEDYEVAAIDAVKVRLADADAGALWPEGEAENPYVISGNPIVLAQVDDALPSYLEVIRQELAAMPKYRPCKLSLPASMDIRAGDVVTVVDRNGVSFQTCVMTRTQVGQRDTLECTGSAKRDSATAANNKSVGQIAQQAVDAQSQRDIFNKLTDGGKIQGIYVQDGKWYINAEVAQILNLVAEVLKSVKDDLTITVSGAQVDMAWKEQETFLLWNSIGKKDGVEYSAMPLMYMHDYEDGVKTNSGEYSAHYLKLGGTSVMPVVYISGADGRARMWINGEDSGKYLSWKDNGDGTYTLIGT